MNRAAPGSSSASRLIAVTLFVTIAIASASPALGAHGPKKRDYKHEVEALEEQWRGAQISGDVATMDKLLADDYVGISITGQVNTKAQQLDRIRRHLFQLTRMDLVDMKIKLLGQVAIVTSLASVDATSDGSPVTGNFRYTRVYQHMPGGEWKITNFEATRIPGGEGRRRVVAAGQPNPGD